MKKKAPTSNLLLSPEQAPTPIYPSIVHRKRELYAIGQAIDKRVRGPIVPESVFMLHGASGIGKTTFINYSLIPLLKTDYPILPWVKVDFDREYGLPNSRYDCRPGRGRLIIDLVEGLTKSVGEAPSAEFERAQEAWEKAVRGWARCNPTSPQSAQSLAEAEIELVGQFNRRVIPSLIADPGRRPVVIILDTVEEIGDKSMTWLQTSLQAPTVRTGYVLWVMAGRFYIVAKPYNLARSYYRRRLELFDVEQIGWQLPDHHHLASILWRYSHGLPAAARKLALTVKGIERNERRELSAEELVTQFSGQLFNALDDFVSQRPILGAYDSIPVAALRLLSILRLPNYSIVTQLLPGYLREYLGRDVAVDPETIMQQLQAARLVDWDRERRAYTTEEPLRRILADILEHTHRDLYESIHRRAFELFDDWYRSIPEKRRDYLLEALYHRAIILFRLEERPDAFEQLRDMLVDAVEEFYVVDGEPDRDALDKLEDQLDKDVDLRIFLSKEEMAEIVRGFLIKE